MCSLELWVRSFCVARQMVLRRNGMYFQSELDFEHSHWWNIGCPNCRALKKFEHCFQMASVWSTSKFEARELLNYSYAVSPALSVGTNPSGVTQSNRRWTPFSTHMYFLFLLYSFHKPGMELDLSRIVRWHPNQSCGRKVIKILFHCSLLRRLPWVRSTMVFLGPSMQMPGKYLKLGYGRYFAHPVKFIVHSLAVIRYCVFWITESVVK